VEILLSGVTEVRCLNYCCASSLLPAPYALVPEIWPSHRVSYAILVCPYFITASVIIAVLFAMTAKSSSSGSTDNMART